MYGGVTSQAHLVPFPNPPALSATLAGLVAGVSPVCSLELLERGAETDLRWQRRGKEREREGAAVCGNTGSSRETERDCRVPLDLHRHSGCLEGRGEALCVSCIPESGCTSVYVFLCRCMNRQGFDRVRSEFEGHLQKIAEIRRGRKEDTFPSSEGLGRL